MVREALETSGAIVVPEAASSETRVLPEVQRVRSLRTVTSDEARSYLRAAAGDELAAALDVARDRSALDGSSSEPDETEVHHALFLLRRALGFPAPSFDALHVQLRRRAAA
jgi:hypothetical protein